MSLIKKASELTFAENIRALIYGQPGIGKTTLALSAPSPLLLDCDRGVHRINPSHLRDTVPVTKWEDIDQVLNEDLSAYSTLVIDTAGKMIEYMTDFLIRNDPRLRQSDGTLSLKGYGARKAMFKSFFSRVSLLGKNLIFVAHEVEERDGDTRFVRPEIGGSSGNDLMKELDLVGYMEAVGKKRTISFDATEKYYGKNTCNLPDRIEVPDASKTANALMTDIFIRFNEMLNEKVLMRNKYQSLLNHVDTIIENAETLEKVNAAMKTLKELEPIWDSRVQSAHRLSKKAKEQGFIFNRTTSVYEVNTAPRIPTVEEARQHALREAEAHITEGNSPNQDANTLHAEPMNQEPQTIVDVNGDSVTITPITQPRRRTTGARRNPPPIENPDPNNGEL